MAARIPSQSCIICSTPRTGSTLLCALLASTGIAGQPQSYFRKEDAGRWAKRFGLPPGNGSAPDFSAFLDGVLSAGTSPNGVFSVRIMWGSMEELTANLATVGVGLPGSEVDRIGQAFGPPHFIWLRRLDTLAQAISWARAEQTRVWHRLGGETAEAPVRSPAYDFDQIDMLVTTIRAHNDAWQAWFDRNGISPLGLTYEALDADAVDAVRTVLGHLGLEKGKADKISARNIRLADPLSLNWAARYRQDLARREND